MAGKAVVTGAGGFVGSHLVGRLIDEGLEVLALDNLSTGNLRNLDEFRDNLSFSFLQNDVSFEPIKVKGGVDFVFHFASPASPIDYTKLSLETLKVGSYGTHNALNLAKEKGAVFILASTSEVYGDPLVHPQSESYWGNVNPYGARSCYDEAKRYAEAVSYVYEEKLGVEVRIPRIFNTYGPKMRLNDGRLIPSFVSRILLNKSLKIYGDGKQTRSFCYVSDLIDGIFKLACSDLRGPVNLGNSKEFSVMDIAKFIIELTGSKAEIEFLPLPPDDPKVRCPLLDKALNNLDWKPKIELEEGLKKTVDYFSNLQS